MPHLNEFYTLISDLMSTPQVQSMGNWDHHGPVSTLDHSLSVSYISFRMAKRLGLDTRTAARGGLLHDLYLYDKNDRTAHPGHQCFDHPRIAAQNAITHFGISSKEENIIRSHMWPASPVMPRSPEAWLVTLADKYSAVLELCHLYHPRRIRLRLAAVT